MAMAGRIRSSLSLFTKALRSDSLSAHRSALALTDSQVLSSSLCIFCKILTLKYYDVCCVTDHGESNSFYFLIVVLAENGRLRNIDSIAKRFGDLTMAYKGEVKAIVTTVIALPPEEEKELKETLQDIIGRGKKVKVEQKIDPSILGGLVVEFGQKVFDMSIKTRARQMERFLREPANLGNL
ncbi:ATP synthase subunit O, mitochondrial [Quercus suber]|uniref:ATP synthase subunit O, mitochondrial n=1 Tax=Quercus suber TaxID=58331 RepID=UPI0032DF777C